MSADTFIPYLWNPYTGTLLFVIALGYAVRLMPMISNRWIPAIVLVAGTVFFPCVSALAVPVNTEHPTAHLVMRVGVGLVLSVVAWLAHRLAIKRVEKWLKLKFSGGSD